MRGLRAGTAPHPRSVSLCRAPLSEWGYVRHTQWTRQRPEENLIKRLFAKALKKKEDGDGRQKPAMTAQRDVRESPSASWPPHLLQQSECRPRAEQNLTLWSRRSPRPKPCRPRIPPGILLRWSLRGAIDAVVQHVLNGSRTTDTWLDDRLGENPQAEHRIADHQYQHRILAPSRRASIGVNR